MVLIDFGNTGDFAKPVDNLIEKINEVFRGVFRPLQMRRIAKAEVDVELIRKEGKFKEKVQQRAFDRLTAEETRNQINIESIIQKAIDQVKKSAHPENMDNDWIFNFFDKSKVISDEKMQQLWAYILAGEANLPGTFSRRTINSMASFEKKDAQMFTNILGFCWTVDRHLTPFIYAVNEPIYNKVGVNLRSLQYLDEMGLITIDSLGKELIWNSNKINVSYYKNRLLLDFSRRGTKTLKIGHVDLTRAGQELSRICKAKPVDGFQNYICENWRNQGISIIPIS